MRLFETKQEDAVTDTQPNLVLEHLRHIRGQVDGMRSDLDTLVVRMGAFERVLSGSYVNDVNQNGEIDRLKSRVDRIERRLELTEPS